MAQSNNFLSILYCFWEDSIYTTFPVFRDYSARQVAMVRLLNVPASSGAQPITPSLVVIEQNPKSLTWHEAHLALGEYSSLTALQTALDALNSGNCYTLYTGLYSIDKFDNIQDSGGSILLCDDFVITRTYIVATNQTSLIVNLGNALIYTEVIVSGDQTNSGTYYYNTLY